MPASAQSCVSGSGSGRSVNTASRSARLHSRTGALRRSDGGLVGDLASSFMQQFKVDVAIIGISAIDPDGDLMDYDMNEVRVSKAIIRQARKVWLVADSAKLARSAPVRLCNLADLDAVFTDLPLPEPLMQLCAEAGTAVHVAGAEDQG